MAGLPGLLLAIVLGGGCSGGSRRTPHETLAPDVRIVQPVPGAGADPSLDILRKLFPGATEIPPTRMPGELSRALNEKKVLLIPNARRVPQEWWAPLKDYLDRGGAAVFLGRAPLEDRVRLGGGRPRTEAERTGDLLGAARRVEGVSAIQGWQHLNDGSAVLGAVRLAQNPPADWSAISVEVQGLGLWDAMVLDGIPAGRIAAGENSLAFYARGREDTSRLVVECEEADGSYWICPVTVSADWRPCLLHEAGFAYFYGGKGRGGNGDHLVLARARKLSVGLSMFHAPQTPNEHTFDVSDVRFAADPYAAEDAVSWPDLPLLSPPYRRYPLAALRIELEDESAGWSLGQTAIESAMPRARGVGGEDGAPYRWIPVARAVDGEGVVRGWPASLYVEPGTGGVARKWAWIGMDPDLSLQEPLGEILGECVDRLRLGLFLFKAGSRRFSIGPDSNIVVTARCTWNADNVSSLRVAAELWEKGASFPARRVVAAASDPGAPVELDLGRAPKVGNDAEDYVIRLKLEEAYARGRRVYDVIEQPVLLLPATRPPAGEDWVTTVGARFAFGGKALFLLGMNYWPISANGRAPGEYNAHWLEPGMFDPELIRRDLAALESVGVNAVSIQYHEERQAPQLQFFAEEARRRGIWIHSFISGFQPLDQDLERARALFEAADLRNQPRVFAVDLAWEPRLGPYAARCRFDDEWAAWLAEQYGSVPHAEKVIGRRLWKEKNRVTGPPDHELTTNGESRVAVEVYRRFVDDLMSRRYGQIARRIRSWGGRQLLGARTGFGGTGSSWADPYFPMDPAAGAMHFDFISPEGWGLSGAQDQFREAGFITAYARGVANGKPVAWVEFGTSVGADPRAADLLNQARIYANMFDLVTRSRAAACFGWWYPGGWRVDERTDMGVVHPDGTWRPVGDVFRQFTHRLRREKWTVDPWRGREVNRGADARGLSALWARWRSTYRQELADSRMEEVRPVGFGKRTGDTSFRSTGGVAFEDPAPMESVNAEWGQILADGVEQDRRPGQAIRARRRQKLRMELINTGAATWDASEEGKTGSVWVGLESPQNARQKMPVGFVRFGDRVWISWLAAEPGRWRLRPLVSGIGAFGEPLEIEVSEERASDR
ncbi:MAG: hypothetical protein BWK77_04345 [Verrucomicrobia bacterium A1]|nr:MAG: hypothetical protein BWK77_04345 [Verrucomicrobia bacterium A1]